MDYYFCSAEAKFVWAYFGHVGLVETGESSLAIHRQGGR